MGSVPIYRTGYRCRSRNGGCCGCWNKGRNGRCFGAGNRRCYGRRHGSRCGSRAGSRSDTRTGRGSGRRCSAGTRCCWGASTGGCCGCRAWGRSDCRCSDRNGCYTRRCAGRGNEGRVGGRNSPSGIGNGNPPGRSQKAKAKRQNAKHWKYRVGNDLGADEGRGTLDERTSDVTFRGCGFTNTDDTHNRPPRASVRPVRDNLYVVVGHSRSHNSAVGWSAPRLPRG